MEKRRGLLYNIEKGVCCAVKKLLIVVDYQNDFVSGALGFPQAAALEENICAKITAYRCAGDQVVYTMDTHGPNYPETQEGKKLPVPHCLEGTEGWQLYGRVRPLLEGCPMFRKPVFGSGELFAYLQKHPFSSIELAGVVSNICVISNAVLARTAQPEAEILVDAACTASHDPALHEKALDVMAGLQVSILHRDAPAGA